MSEQLWNEAKADEKARIVKGYRDLRTFDIVCLDGIDYENSGWEDETIVIRVIGDWIVFATPTSLEAS